MPAGLVQPVLLQFVELNLNLQLAVLLLRRGREGSEDWTSRAGTVVLWSDVVTAGP